MRKEMHRDAGAERIDAAYFRVCGETFLPVDPLAAKMNSRSAYVRLVMVRGFSSRP